jgi:amino-acid N-acetyltransferase
MKVRKATVGDVPAMQQLVNKFADKGDMLHRSLIELYENVRDFFVIEVDSKVVACAALHISWEDLAEVKSLAVAEDNQGKGWGTVLVEACIEEAKTLDIPRVFALTFKPNFFEKFGFTVAERSSFPRKIWTECIYCPKYPDCNEVAVILQLLPTATTPSLSDSLMP